MKKRIDANMPKLAEPLIDIQPRNAKDGVKPKGFGGRTTTSRPTSRIRCPMAAA
jgi:hypothetical protein